MKKAYYINKGGVHTVGEKEVRTVPLSPREYAVTLPNSGVPSDTDNSISPGEINLGRYDEFKDLKVGDCIFVELFPDAMLYRGLWAMTQNPSGLKLEVSLVDANDVWAANCAEADTCAVEPKGTVLNFDMTKCLGNTVSQAIPMGDAEVGGDCNTWLENYRNHNDPLQWCIFPLGKQYIAQIGHPMYLRLTVKGLPETADTCGTCGSLPCIQLGVIVDNICVIKGFVNDPCQSCPDFSCVGEDCDKC